MVYLRINYVHLQILGLFHVVSKQQSQGEMISKKNQK